MVKDFFIGLGVTVIFLWTLLGIIILIIHISIGQFGNWWGVWDWAAIIPILWFALWGANKVLIGIGENVRKGTY